MKIYRLPTIVGLLLLTACNFGLNATPAGPPPPPVDVSPAAAVTPPPTQPPLVEPPPAPPATPFPGLGKPLPQALPFDLTGLEFFVDNDYSLAGYYPAEINGATYLALSLEPPPPPGPEAEAGETNAPALVFYRLQDNRPQLLEPQYFNAIIEVDPAGWRDVNGDAVPDLPVRFNTGGDDWRANFWRLFSVNSEGVLTDLLDNLFTTTTAPVEAADLNGDGLLEIKVVDVAWQGWAGLCPDCSPQAYRYYGWQPDRKVYADYSARFPAPFLADIEIYTQRLTAAYAQPLDFQTVAGPAVSLLLAYDSLGRREQGWEQFRRLTDPANWPETPAEALAQLEALRVALAGQFENQRPFLPEAPPGN